MPLKTSPRVYILLPAHNRIQTTSVFIQALKAQDYPDWQLVFIDDGCTDGTRELVEREVPGARILLGDGNLWWAGALQKGYEWLMAQSSIAPDDVVLIINDDTRFEPDYISKGVRLLEARPRCVVGTAAYNLATGELRDPGIHADWSRLSFAPARSPDEVNCLSTRGLFLRYSSLKEIGGFRARELPHYAADYEFTMRAHRLGFKLVVPPELKLRYDEAATGIHDVKYTSFGDFREKYFSLRNVRNPIIWTRFVWLACPPRWLPLNLARVAKNFTRDVAKFALSQVRKA